MDISTLANLTNGKVVTNTNIDEMNIEFAMASDLMSDVLTLDTTNTLLITGLANLQTIRTAEMSDVHCIILARNKKATPEMIVLAEVNDIIIIESPHAMYKISGILYTNGLREIY